MQSTRLSKLETTSSSVCPLFIIFLSVKEANNPDKASWLTSFFICAAVYLALSKISPPTSTFVDRTVESLDDELHSADQHDIQDGHELAAWEKKKSTSNDSASEEKVAPYNGGAPGL